MMEQCKEKLNIAMFGQKRIPSREGGVEIVVEELCTRMVAQEAFYTFIYAANSFCVIFNSRRRLSIFADIFANSIIDFASASAIPSVSHVVSCAFDILSYMLMFHSSVLL